MKNSKRLISVLVAVIMVLAVFAGCSGAKKETVSEATAQSSSTAASSEPKAEVKAPSQISFLFWADAVQQQILVNAIEKFNSSNKSNITVRPDPRGASVDFNTILQPMIAAKALPDCSYMPETDVQRYYEKGVITDLTDMFSSGEINKKLDSVTFKTNDGKILGAGLSNQLMLMYYNKDIFDQEGVAYPPSTLDKAWTWDQFLDTAKKLTKDSKGKHPGESGFDAKNIATFGVNFGFYFQFSFMWAANSNGGGAVSPDGKEYWWDKPETIDAIQKVADLSLKEHVAPVSGSNQAGSMGGTDQSLLSKKVAMVIAGSWDIANAGNAKKDGLNYGMAVLPKFKDAVTMNCGAPLVVYKSSKYPDAAKEFYKYMMDPEQIVDILKTGAWLPNEERWYTDAEYLNKWITGPNFAPEAKDVICGYAANGTAPWPAYFVAPWARMYPVTDAAFQAVFAGSKTADAAIKEFTPQVKPIFESGKASE